MFISIIGKFVCATPLEFNTESDNASSYHSLAVRLVDTREKSPVKTDSEEKREKDLRDPLSRIEAQIQILVHMFQQKDGDDKMAAVISAEWGKVTYVLERLMFFLFLLVCMIVNIVLLYFMASFT